MKRVMMTFITIFATAILFAACSGGGSSGGNTSTGKDSIAAAVQNTAPADICPYGGITVQTGIDTSGNGILDPSEVQNTQYVCNGTGGTNGKTALVSVTSEPSGTNCSAGGKKVSVGLDTNGNGILDASEVTSTNYICNGANGTNGANGLNSLTSIVTEPSGSNCSYGGLKITSGLDTNGNGALDPGEVTTTSFSCSSDFAPVIESITIYPQPVLTSANLLANVFDQNGDSLTYSWTIGGTGIATGASAIWNSPGIPGYYLVGLAVSDGTYTVNGTSSISVASASPWPKFHRDVQSTGISPVDTSATAGTLKWSYTTGGVVQSSSPAIGADGTVYVGSYDNKLYAINPNGTLKWSYTTGGGVVSSPAIGADGTVYVGSSDDKLYAINPNGTLRWSYMTGSNVFSSPAIGADGTVYVGSDDYKLYAINPNGTLKWSYTTGGGVVNSAPAIGADGTVYVGSFDNKLYAINPNGTLKWSYMTGDGVASYPAIGADGTVYVGSDDYKLYAINPNGTLKWSYTTGAAVQSSPAIGADGTVYVGSQDYKLYAINPNGTLKWSYTTGYPVSSSPAIGADGTVYVGSWDYKLYAINPNGTLKWNYTTGYAVLSSPAIGADGTVYVGSNDSKLYAIK